MSKAPTGITISRNGGSYAVSWKCGDKNYGKGQQFQYRINSGKWTSLSVGANTRAKTVALNLANYYPTSSTILYSVSVRIRGKVNSKKSTWSAWSTKTYTNYVPNVPNLEASLDEQQTNKCTFTWNLTTEVTDARPYYHVRWETILVKESDVTDGSKLTWDSSALGWDTGAGSYASSVTETEDTSLLADASYTRWFRVCGRGARGSSAWRYAKHVYARPFQAKIEEAEVTQTDAEGLTCYAKWKADQTASHPIDYTSVQYLITVPNAGLTCPSGAQWSDANISADTEATDAVRFSIDDVLDKDECLFVRVNTVHDTNITYSEPKLAAVGDLKDPTDLSYQVDNVNHTLTSVSVDNNSDVPDSFIAITYKAGSNPENEIVVGIIPHGASQPLVTPVQCPDWSGESAFSIGAYAVVGSYEANSVGYTVKAEMRSAGTIWVGGAVPVAPENVNVVQSPITGTATVTWDWTWEEATFAQLSWTDHDDAWESTDEPEIYNITKPKATKWNISGLELGKKWFIAVRLVSGNPEDENAIYSPWSEMKDITLSSVPNIPTLNLSSSVITEGEEITASWDFVSNDGTGQISAEIKDEDDNLIAHTETQNEVVIDTEALGWAQGEVHSLSVRVTSESNRTTDWSNPVSIVVAEALEGYIAETSLEMKTVEVNPESFEKTDFLSFLTEQEEVFTKLQVDLDPIQDLHGFDAPWVGGAGKNKLENASDSYSIANATYHTYTVSNLSTYSNKEMTFSIVTSDIKGKRIALYKNGDLIKVGNFGVKSVTATMPTLLDTDTLRLYLQDYTADSVSITGAQLELGSTATTWQPYSNICPITGHDSVDVEHTGKNIANLADIEIGKAWNLNTNSARATMFFPIQPNTTYTVTISGGTFDAIYWGELVNKGDLVNNRIYAPSSFPYTVTTKETSRVGLIQFNKANVSSSDFVNVNVQVELGSTATAYEPYSAESFHQDIEKTYTPTVQENEAYLFKQTGDVGGDRETIELVGGTVAWNQLVPIAGNSKTKTESNVTITDNRDGSYTVQTTQDGASADVNLTLTSATTSKGGHVGILYGCPSGGYVNKSVKYRLWDAWGGIGNDYGNGHVGKWVAGGQFEIRISVASGTVITTPIKFVPQLFDLTAMFGSTIADYIYSLEQATAGAGVAWFRKLFPKPYYAYNAGELMSVNTSAHNTVGFNAWDEVTELGYISNSNGENVASTTQIRGKNYIPVIPNATYYFKSPTGLFVYFYDANKKYIGVHGSGTRITNNTITLGADVHYIRVSMASGYGTTYNHDITINLSWDGERDGEYEEYVKHSYPLDSDLTLRGIPKLDASNNLYYDGDVYESDGTVTRKYGVKVLNGTEKWVVVTADPNAFFLTGISDAVNSNSKLQIVPSNFTERHDNTSAAGYPSNSIWFIYKQIHINADTSIAPSGLTSEGISELKSWLSTHPITVVYPLATPTTETADAFEEIQKVTPVYGTEEFADNRTTPMPVYTKTQYLTRDVYGGYIDFVNGLLVVSHGVVDGGTLSWSYWYGNNFYAVINGKTANSTGDVKCEIYETTTGGTGQDNDGIFNQLAENQKGSVYIKDSTLSTDATGAARLKALLSGHKIWYRLAEPMIFQLTPQQIQAFVGKNNVWSEQGQVVVKIAETYKDVLSLTRMPLIVKLAGVNDNIISTLTVERTADYHMDRPDETQFDGFEGEIVYLTSQNGGEDIIINQEDLIGLMDDEAPYKVFVTFKDVYGQSMNDSVDFEVHWDHQAIVPEATVEIDQENLIAKLTPVAPTGTLEGDTCDIYRLSADRPELIVKDAVFGTQYVDPYPAIGEFGGHRFVFKTANGDYITEDNDIAWFDTGEEDGDILESEKAIIDFDGNQLLLYYNVDVGHQWDKDFQQTKYLGGSIQGDWNAGVSRSGSISAVMITLTDSDQIRMMRELAVYTGVCHVRTTDGSSYTADVQVSEDRDHDDYGKLASFSLTITRVDAETLDGLTYEQWSQEEE